MLAKTGNFITGSWNREIVMVGNVLDLGRSRGQAQRARVCQPEGKNTFGARIRGDELNRAGIEQERPVQAARALTYDDEYRRVFSGTDRVGSERDVEEGKGALSCEPLYECTTPPPSFNQAGDAINQKQSIRSSTSLRTDVPAAASSSLHEFDAKRVVCIYNVSEEDAVEILFLNVKGMATMFGVGLEYSLVHLWEEGVMEIKQLPPKVWRDRWSVSQMSNFSLVCLDCSTVSALTSRSANHAFSPEHAAEQCDMGLGGGQNYVQIGDVSNAPASALAWTPGFWNNLFRSRSCHGGKVVPDPTMQSGPTQGATIPLGDQQGSQGQGLPHVTATESGIQNQPLHLTVIIYLACDRYTLYDAASEKTMEPVATPDGNIRFIDSETRKVVPDVDPVLGDFSMVPVVTIKFLYYRDSEGRDIKKMITTLDVKFLNDSVLRIEDDSDKFGWYHDGLILSFKCSREGEVRREAREHEILSSHGIRIEDRGTSLAVVGKGENYQECIRIKQVRSGNWLPPFFSSRKKDTSDDQELSSNFRLMKKDTVYDQKFSLKQGLVFLTGKNFVIQTIGTSKPELAYLASVYSPLAPYEIWCDRDRKIAGLTGIMGTVHIQIEGDWEIKEDADSLCEYDFLCRRNLEQLRRNLKQEREGKRRGSIVTEVLRTRLEQKLTCCFTLNHSFSHMKNVTKT